MCFNNNYNFNITSDNFYNIIDTFEPVLSNINNLNEHNNGNYFNFPINEENEITNEYIFSNILKEENIQFQGNNNDEDYSPFNENFYAGDNQKNDFLGKKYNINNDNNFTFKKNRNNLNNNIFKTTNKKNEKNNNNISSETSSNSHIKKIKPYNIRTDSFLIKFKSFLGNRFIKHINAKLKKLTKRKIKFYAFNYTKFTLIVTYNQNKEWLNEKMRNLLILGGEANQEKNEKALKSLHRRKEEEFDEIKNLLEMNYKEVIERFYSTKYFDEFKSNQKNIKSDEEFNKIMKISLLEKNGFITFLLSRKGNKEKSH